MQFEYGGTTEDSGTTLKQAYALLESRGFAVGRLLEDRVELRPYDSAMEDFGYSNYVAVSKRIL